jgi:hypothetical protein
MPHEHLILSEDSHLKRVPGGMAYCQCFGPCCFDSTTQDCICEDGCTCRSKSSPVTPIRDITQAESYAGRPVTTLSLPGSPQERSTLPQRTCADCGNPVVRNGTRGRYPKKCQNCKAK